MFPKKINKNKNKRIYVEAFGENNELKKFLDSLKLIK